MQLFGSFTSPYVRHCRVTMAQTGTEFEFVETNSAQSAKLSPTWKVPMLRDGDLVLTDSTSILRHVREKSGGRFLDNVQEQDLFAMAATILDASANLFMIELDGYGPDQIPYLRRQQDRIESGVAEFNRRVDPAAGISNDANLRFVCYMGWAIFRNRFDFSAYDKLTALLDNANQSADFTDTEPFG